MDQIKELIGNLVEDIEMEPAAEENDDPREWPYRTQPIPRKEYLLESLEEAVRIFERHPALKPSEALMHMVQRYARGYMRLRQAIAILGHELYELICQAIELEQK